MGEVFKTSLNSVEECMNVINIRNRPNFLASMVVEDVKASMTGDINQWYGVTHTHARFPLPSCRLKAQQSCLLTNSRSLVSMRSIKFKWDTQLTGRVEATDQLKGENGLTTRRNVPMNSSYTGHRISPHKGSGQNQLSAVDSLIYVSGTGWNSL